MKDQGFLDLTILVNTVPISGFVDSENAVQMRRLTPPFSHQTTLEGEMIVTRNPVRTGEIILTLYHTSDSNRFLSGLVLAQEAGTLVPCNVLIKDAKGGDLGGGTQGYIEVPAEMVRGTQASPQEWRIVVERLNLLHRSEI